MAACLAKGTSVLHNVAREPEVGDLDRLFEQHGRAD
jgi:UDP-N-acetylglucosamine enolpyruvyl transferase